MRLFSNIPSRDFKRGMRTSLFALAVALVPAGAGFAQNNGGSVQSLMEQRQFEEAIEAIEALHAKGEASSESYLWLAEAYLETGAGIAAEAAIERARRLGADYALTAVPFAKTQLLQGKYPEAIGALRGVTIPQDMRALAAVIQGDANFAQKKYAEAQKNYVQARSEDPRNFQAALGLSRLALEAGKLEVAADYAREAERLAPENTMVQYTGGMIARYRGDVDSAEQHFMEAVRVFPGNILANIELAAIKIDNNRMDEAQVYLDAIYKAAPKHPMAQFLSGTILASRGRYEEAATLLNNARSVTENYLPAVYIRGMVLYELGQYALAENLLKKVLQARPDNQPARLALSGLYLKQQKPKTALEILQPALAASPDNTEVIALAAAAAMRAGDTQQGEALYERLGKATSGKGEPVNTGMQAKLAMAKFVAGKREAGLSSMAEIVSNNSADVRSLALLGEMQMREKDLDGAEATIDKIIQIAPDRGLGYNMKGSIEYTRGDYQAAHRSFSTAVARNPEYYTALRNKGLAQLRLGNLDGAESDLRKLLDVQPNDARAKAMLGRVLLRQDKASEAVGFFEGAVRAIPNSVDLWADYSDALAGAGKTSEAIEQAKDTAVMGADRPDILKRMGLLLLRLGEARVAVRPLSRYVAFHPDNGEAHLMQGRAQLAMRLYTGAKTSFVRAEKAREQKPDNDILNWYIFAADAQGGRFDEALARRSSLVASKRPEDIRPSVVGDLLLASGRLDDAITAYRNAQATGENGDIVIGLARALDARGDKQDAIRALEGFVDKYPANREARLALGRKYTAAGRTKAAAMQYEAILRGGVADAHVAALLAQAYLETGDRKSLPLIERAYLIRPEDPFILDSYGWIMLQARRDTSTAIAALEKATRRAPSVALYRFHLGMAYLARGQRDDAQKAFEDALNLDPDFPEAGEARRQIELLN